MICETAFCVCWHGNPARYRIQSLGANVSTGGTHKSWFTTDVTRPGREEQGKKNDSQWTEKRAERNEGERRGHKGENNRPITWVTEDDRSRESRRQKSYLTGIANTMGAAKPIHKARNSAYGRHRAHSSSSSSFSSSLSFLLLPRRRHDRSDRMPQPVVVLVPLQPFCVYASSCAPSLFRWTRDHSLFLSFIRVN